MTAPFKPLECRIRSMEEMANPFVYGPVVTGPDFVDRESELRDLGRHIRSGKSVVLYSNRRMGKSSLLAEMIRRRDDDPVSGPGPI